jgi:hypothetical protein
MSKSILASAVMMIGLVSMCLAPAATNAQWLSPAEARAIAKEAYIYGFPPVDSYRILYSYFVDRSSPEYKAGWNERVANNPRVFTPDDKAMQTPNSDTPYSHLRLAKEMVRSLHAHARLLWIDRSRECPASESGRPISLCPKLCPRPPLTGPKPATASQAPKEKPLGKSATYRGASICPPA